ncbi:uncharacterized protein BKCO1_4600080 [Diplodia corticola]|uniref:Uncharacterized protein n=1 Tax=Diplodia corticola TaxID=236234 RepID=A0A1J9QT86_9PEZI|nr:uncharacterized protein BKCO1_4600080 [Diplodia corticola]OJD31617.1 hypothetical protein BKCO1_4600080 [Diplodia corticola]
MSSQQDLHRDAMQQGLNSQAKKGHKSTTDNQDAMSEGLKQKSSSPGGGDAFYGKQADEEIKRPAGARTGG